MPARTIVVALSAFLLFAGVLSAALAVPASADSTTAAPGTQYTFKLNRTDKAALRARKRALRIAGKAEHSLRQMENDDARIAGIQELLQEAAGDETALRDALQARLIEQYKHGSPSDWSFVLASDGIGDAVDRTALLHASRSSDARLAADYQVSLQRLEDLEAALEELRDVHGEQAALYQEQAASLVALTSSARQDHVEDSKVEEEGAGLDGKWYVVNGQDASGYMSLMGGFGGAYSGGTRTPARPSTQLQIMTVLGDPRIEIYAGGRQDIAAGRIDGRLLQSLYLMANRFGSLHITSLMSGHGVYTASGNVSEHSFGCAADIGSLSGIVIQPGTQGTGSITEQGALFLGALGGDLAPHQVISLNSYGGPTLAMGDHGDHIHLGYSC